MLHEFSSCLPFFLYHALRQKASSCFLHSNKQENAVISVIECKSIDLCGMRLPFSCCLWAGLLSLAERCIRNEVKCCTTELIGFRFHLKECASN